MITAKTSNILFCFAVFILFIASMTRAQTSNSIDWETFQLTDLLEQREQTGRSYYEFLNTATLSTGLYVLAAGSTDQQRPHRQDEVYHVLEGKAVLNVDGVDQDVKAGSIIFVKAGVLHNFHSIEVELSILVFFSKAEAE